MTHLALLRAFQRCCKREFENFGGKMGGGTKLLIDQGLVKIGKYRGRHIRLTKKGRKLRDELAYFGLTGWYSKEARELEMLRAAEILVRLAESEQEIANFLDAAYQAEK